MKLEVVARADGPTRTLEAKGDVDMDSSPELRDAIKRSLKGATVLRIDLSGVGYMDSSGIAVLIQGMRWAMQSKTEFRLLNPSAQVNGVIELSQLQTVFKIERTGA